MLNFRLCKIINISNNITGPEDPLVSNLVKYMISFKYGRCKSMSKHSSSPLKHFFFSYFEASLFSTLYWSINNWVGGGGGGGHIGTIKYQLRCDGSDIGSLIYQG